MSSSSGQQHPGTEAHAAPAPPHDATYLNIPGVRFVPSDQELIQDYLWPKIHGQKPLGKLVHEANVYAEHPKDLTKRLGKSREGFWYVFSPRNRRYAKGKRPSRSTGDAAGRWKPVGKNRTVPPDADEAATIGHKCALSYELFVRDDPTSRPRIEKTEWKMCEFVAGDTNKPISKDLDYMKLNDFVLCRITRKGAAVVDEPDEEEQMQPDLPPPDPSQQARHQGAEHGFDGTVIGAQGVADAGLEPPPPPPRDGDDGAAADAQWPYHSEHYGVAYDHDQWNQFGATADPGMVSQLQVPADPIELPSDPLPWHIASSLFFPDASHENEIVEDEIVRANDCAPMKPNRTPRVALNF